MATSYNALDPEAVDDQYVAVAQLRQVAPVSEIFPGVYYVSRYDDVLRVLHDPTTFPQGGMAAATGEAQPVDHLALFELDPPEHTSVRRRFTTALSPTRSSPSSHGAGGVCRAGRPVHRSRQCRHRRRLRSTHSVPRDLSSWGSRTVIPSRSGRIATTSSLRLLIPRRSTPTRLTHANGSKRMCENGSVRSRVERRLVPMTSSARCRLHRRARRTIVRRSRAHASHQRRLHWGS